MSLVEHCRISLVDWLEPLFTAPLPSSLSLSLFSLYTPISPSILGKIPSLESISQKGQRTKCGHRISSTASALSSLMFRYWSTLLSVPRIWTSFLSSTVISCSTRVLKKLGVVHWLVPSSFSSARGVVCS